MMKRKLLRKQNYTLDGKWVASSEVLGFVHTAKKKEGFCPACCKPIKIGEQYVLLNTFSPATIHLYEYMMDHPTDCILGVKKKRCKDVYGVLRGYVECVNFSLTWRRLGGYEFTISISDKTIRVFKGDVLVTYACFASEKEAEKNWLKVLTAKRVLDAKRVVV